MHCFLALRKIHKAKLLNRNRYKIFLNKNAFTKWLYDFLITVLLKVTQICGLMIDSCWIATSRDFLVFYLMWLQFRCVHTTINHQTNPVNCKYNIENKVVDNALFNPKGSIAYFCFCIKKRFIDIQQRHRSFYDYISVCIFILLHFIFPLKGISAPAFLT